MSSDPRRTARPARIARAILRLAAALAAAGAAAGDDGLLTAGDLAHLDAALARLNATRRDLSFAKDHADYCEALPLARRILADPLELPRLGARALAAARGGESSNPWTTAAAWLEAPLPDDPGPRAGGRPDPALEAVGDAALRLALAELVDAAGRARASCEEAFDRLSPERRAWACAIEMAGAFDAEDDADARAALLSAGIPEPILREAIASGDDIDPEPVSTAFLAVVRDTRLGALLAAGRAWTAALDRLARASANVREWPSAPLRLRTAEGEIVVGTTGSDAHEAPALLILDPGGDDRYGGGAGQANGLLGRPVAGIVDLAGNDVYAGAGLPGIGGAWFGVCAAIDRAGDDVSRPAFGGAASACFGAATWADGGGDDVYRARARAQAAATVGFARLDDAAGRDLYEIGLEGQAFAGPFGVAFLIDRDGNDRYLAGGLEPDHERLPHRHLSLAQGFAIGRRPYIGGGVAALVDLRGDDVYVADVYGQGASYWYSAALLLDAAGADEYHVYQYGQGSGIHLSGAMLWDGAGDDVYDGANIVQGAAHDFAVGICADRAGNDQYRARDLAQGAAVNCSFALALDAAGDDQWTAAIPDLAQGRANDGGLRACDSIGALLDLGGADRYSAGAADGARRESPNGGIVYDTPAPPADGEGAAP